MFILLKRHHEVCLKLETELLHALHEAHRLHEELRLIRDYASRIGGLYKCLIECRELAEPLTQGRDVDYFHQKEVLKSLPVEEVYRDIRFGCRTR